ncbi:MAG: VCBS repeat-containing protein, partial [Phycisphaerales bacterium]|nr:VCBS repeat-containing protein [Phycisphaerales bacterium]
MAGAAASILVFAGSADAGGVPNAFTQEAIPRGLNYIMQPHIGSYGWFGFGAGFADLDSDGDSDVIIMGNAAGTVGIFENVGGGMFVDRSSVANMPVLPEGSAFGAGDYNGDGLIDIYLTQIGPTNFLMRNDGGFTFTDVTAAAGVGDTGASKGASWGDFDNDGWLD